MPSRNNSMMKMMEIMVKKSIRIFLIIELLIFITYFYSQTIFLNLQIAFLSAFLIILGSSYSYKRMIDKKIDSQEFEDERDPLDKIDDPHELYEEQDSPSSQEDVNFKEIIKEEKAKIKTLSLKNAKHGVKGGISAMRLVPYILLVLGFIGLENNHILELSYYLPALLIGVFAGSFVSREILLTQ